jgi:hypothetical protein
VPQTHEQILGKKLDGKRMRKVYIRWNKRDEFSLREKFDVRSFCGFLICGVFFFWNESFGLDWSIQGSDCLVICIFIFSLKFKLIINVSLRLLDRP